MQLIVAEERQRLVWAQHIAAILDPQHRQFYEICWEALERAGLETGRRDRVSHVLEQGRIRLVLTGTLQGGDEIAAHHALHGDGVAELATDHLAPGRTAVVLGSAAAAFALALAMVPTLGLDLIPQLAQDRFEMTVKLPPGTQLRVEKVMDVTISREVERLERRLTFLATVGSIAHADPSGEMTSVLALTDGSVTVATLMPSPTSAANT